MQLQGVLVKIAVTVYLSLGLFASALAGTFKEDDSLICSVYLTIAVDDLMPTGGMSATQAQNNLTGSYMRLAAMSLAHDIPAKDVARRYSEARKHERQNMTINGQPASRLIYSNRSLEYSKLLIAKTQQYCMHSKGDIERVFNDMPQSTTIPRVKEIKAELQAIGEDLF